MSWWCKGSTLSRHVRGLGFDSRVRSLFSIDPLHVISGSSVYSVTIDRVVFTPCYSSLSACTVERGAP